MLLEPELDLTAPQRVPNLIAPQRVPNRTQLVAWEYQLPGLGLYTLQLRYQYTGPADAQQTVFRGAVLSNLVQFRRR